jgi:hypothetical protein
MTLTDRALESSDESDVIKFAKVHGWWIAKFVSPGLRGVPDRIFIREGRVLFIELKRNSEEPTVQQLKRHREMRRHGAEVHWVNNLADAFELLR